MLMTRRDSEHPSKADQRLHWSALEMPEVAKDDDVPTDGKVTHFKAVK